MLRMQCRRILKKREKERKNPITYNKLRTKSNNKKKTIKNKKRAQFNLYMLSAKQYINK
jgi:hypothetical protein